AEAADRNEPSVVSKYAYTVAKAFNKFYNACQVIGSEHEGRLLKLVEAAGCTIGRCLGLLGMEALDQM
ncbi:MAG: arginine--tRNA ligase, partial [Oscillospiraceae bacterium]|nr:arginine--tRNA ligase [Oscillospiraceae bacterium]